MHAIKYKKTYGCLRRRM